MSTPSEKQQDDSEGNRRKGEYTLPDGEHVE